MKLNERELLHAMLNADMKTWKELSDKSGVPRRTLYNLRVGAGTLTIDQCYDIKKALDLTKNQFFNIFQEDC